MCFSVNIFRRCKLKWYTLKVFSKLCGRMEMANGIIGPLLLLLFLNRVSSHHYLYHCQNMEPRYPSSKSREPVSENRIILCAYLETTIGQTSGFCLLANDNFKRFTWSCPCDKKQRKLLLALIFKWTFQRLIARMFELFLLQLFCLM